LRPVLVLSPHLDDAVLSTGQFLCGRPDITVATLFAGVPPADIATDYDRKCGFRDSSEAVTARRAEDIDALATLDVAATHLDFFDHQYGFGNDLPAMVGTVANLIKTIAPEYVLAPLGLLHPDHVTARDVTLAAATTTPVVLYEELPYRVTHPEAVAEAMVAVRRALKPVFIGDGPLHRKLTALWSYRSQMQLAEFDAVHPLMVPERYWRATS
jgi:LmbE family N-acetylglucosaminyl deacetylase